MILWSFSIGATHFAGHFLYKTGRPIFLRHKGTGMSDVVVILPFSGLRVDKHAVSETVDCCGLTS